MEWVAVIDPSDWGKLLCRVSGDGKLIEIKRRGVLVRIPIDDVLQCAKSGEREFRPTISMSAEERRSTAPRGQGEAAHARDTQSATRS